MKYIPKFVLYGVLIGWMSMFWLVFAFPIDKRGEAVTLVNRGIQYLKKHGQQKAFQAFENTNGTFIHKDLYLFVMDTDGNLLSHGANPELIGKNQLELTDAESHYFIKDFIYLAQTKGDGWVDYLWRSPVTKTVLPKTTYIKKIPKSNLFIGCGIYKE